MSAVLTKPGIEIEVCLGLSYVEYGEPWDSGVWDRTQWQQAQTELGNWYDVTCQTVDGFQLTAGSSADGVTTRWEAATCALQLVGSQFDPRSGPWAGLLGPALPLRVRWRPLSSGTWLTAFIGQTDDDGYAYDPITKLTDVAATDRTRRLSTFDAIERGWAGFYETAAQRVTRIANAAYWPAGERDIEAGGVPVLATNFGANAWDMMLKLADTDLSLLWVSRAGLLSFRPEGHVEARDEIDAVISCGPVPGAPAGMAPVKPINIVNQQPTVTRNIVTIAPAKREDIEEEGEPEAVTMTDERSVARFYQHGFSATDLIHANPGWTTAIAAAVLITSAWPSTAPDTAELDSRLDPVAAALLLGMEPSFALIVADGINSWHMEPSGWDVLISRNQISGTIHLLDVSYWYPPPGAWDSAGWDVSKWGWAH